MFSNRFNSKTMVLTIGIAMLIVLCSLVLVYYQGRENVIKVQDQQYVLMTNELSKDFTDFFDDGVLLTHRLKKHTMQQFDVDAYIADDSHVEDVKDSMYDMMMPMIRGENIYSAYIYFNPDLTGRPNDIWLKDESLEGNFVRLKEVPVTYYEQATADKDWYFKTKDQKEGLWQLPRYNTVFNSEELMFSYNESIYVDDLFIGVVGVEYSSRNLEKIAVKNRKNYDCHLWIANSDGHMIYHPLDIGYQPVEDYLGHIGIDELIVSEMKNINGKIGESIKLTRIENGWIVGATFFNTELKKQLKNMMFMLLTMILLGVIVLIGVSHLISIRLSEPLRKLTKEIDKIESGSFDGNISQELLIQKSAIGHLAVSIFQLVESKKNALKEVGKQRDEIIHLYEETYAINADLENTLFQKELLYDDLNIMFKKLENANIELENRVAERTEELNVKNKALENALKDNKKNNRNLRKLNKELEKSIKDLTLAQERLVESEKMVALGNMMSGIAHEINTPLGVSLTATSYILDQFNELEGELLTMSDEDLMGLLNDVTESSEIVYGSLKRSIELVGSFKEVAVNQHSNEKLAFDLLDYTKTVTRSLRHEYRHVVEELDIDIPIGIEVYSFPGAYSQIISNLVMNSIKHGFEDKINGRITIKAWQTGKTVVLHYNDNGKGISNRHLKKVFEPFFTTKRANGGTGLGLSVVYNLVNTALMGDIECNSTIDVGTQFKIAFPVNIDVAGEQE